MSQLLFQWKFFVDRLRRFPEEKGVTAPEYGLMLGLVCLAVAFAVPNITNAILLIFGAVSTELTTLSTP